MMISALLATSWQFFFKFFLDIERFYQILATCQVSDQLHHSNRNYRGGGGRISPPAIPICKSPACIGLIMLRIHRRLRLFKYLKNISILSLYARNVRNLYQFWLSEKRSNSYSVNKLFIILKHVIWTIRIYILYLYIYIREHLNFPISMLK